MKHIHPNYIILFLLLLVSKALEAQVSAIVNLNRKSVYVQEPFHVTVTVYTKTWFTQPVEFGNLQIPGSFIVPFDATQPGMFTIGDKQYPGIQFYYIVFPYKAGNFTVPSLEITAQSPPEGSSESRKVVIHTTPQSFVVKDVPDNLKEKGTWFVAKNVILHETWAPSSTKYKTGDVIKRTITINASGTLPQFIPDLKEQEKLSWASSYPQDAVLTDTRGGGDVNGKSVQTTTYLLEKAGDFTIPGITLSYWNPYSAKILTAKTNPVKIHVDENPNLGILKTLKDSLSATISTQSTPQHKGPFLILGMPWYKFIGGAIVAIILLYFIIRLGKKLYKQIRLKRSKYIQSEKYLFKKFIKSDKEPHRFLSALYKWWDSFSDKPSASIGVSMDDLENNETGKTVKDYFDKTLQNKESDKSDEIKESMKKYRNSREKEKDNTDDNYYPM